MGNFSSPKDSEKTTKRKNTGKTPGLKSNPGLYKPLEAFAWEDASDAEIRENSIAAYRKYAF